VAVALIAVISWSVLVSAGAVTVSLVSSDLRRRLSPALPALGVMALMVVLHATSLLTSTRPGMVFAAVVLVGVAVLQWRRGQRWLPSSTVVWSVVVAALLGAVPFAVAVAPGLHVGRPTVVQPAWNNDAFAYVTVTDWLQEHRALDRPHVTHDPPVYGYTRTHIDSGLRIGEELVHAVMADVNGRDPAETWYTVMALWVLLLPGAYAAATDILGIGRLPGLIAGLLVGLSAPLLGQAFAQNSASLLGIALAPLVVALVIRAADRAGPTQVPLWLGAGALSAFVGTYTEFLPFVGPALLLYACLRRPARWKDPLLGLVGVGVLSVVTAPLVWFNAARSLAYTSGITGPGTRSAYLDVAPVTSLNRVLGITPLHREGTFTATTAVLLATLAVGLATAVSVTPARRTVSSLLAASAALVLALSTFHRFPYGQQRAVEIAHPLWIFAAVIGVSAFVQRARDRHLGSAAMVVVVVGLLPAAAFVRANMKTVSALAAKDLALARNVDDSFEDAKAWVERHSGPAGSDVLVLESSFFEQHWLLYQLRHQRRLAYPFLHPDYNSVDRYRFFDRSLRRFALIGRSTYVAADPGVVIHENRRFLFLDLSKGGAVVVAVTRNFFIDDDPSPTANAHWMSDDGELLVLHTPDVGRIELRGNALADVAPMLLSIETADSQAGGEYVIGLEETRFHVDLPSGTGTVLRLHNHAPARTPRSGADPRLLSFLLTRVDRG
jgi:hypothetical protein